jgi:serine/threonine protein kinase
MIPRFEGFASFRDLLTRKIDRKIRYRLTAKLLRILQNKHALHIAHGDIHHGNIVIGALGRPVETLTLVDFGKSHYTADSHYFWEYVRDAINTMYELFYGSYDHVFEEIIETAYPLQGLDTKNGTFPTFIRSSPYCML